MLAFFPSVVLNPHVHFLRVQSRALAIAHVHMCVGEGTALPALSTPFSPPLPPPPGSLPAYLSSLPQAKPVGQNRGCPPQFEFLLNQEYILGV